MSIATMRAFGRLLEHRADVREDLADEAAVSQLDCQPAVASPVNPKDGRH